MSSTSESSLLEEDVLVRRLELLAEVILTTRDAIAGLIRRSYGEQLHLPPLQADLCEEHHAIAQPHKLLLKQLCQCVLVILVGRLYMLGNFADLPGAQVL